MNSINKNLHVEEFHNLVNNQFMPSFDYAGTDISFKTVFFISDYSYCCCMCGYEHEYFDYISESGKINEETYDKIVKCLSEGKCPHVDKMSPECLKETGYYAINLATAVGTKQALNHHVTGYLRTAVCRNSHLFHLGPFEIALMKNPHAATLPVMEQFATSHPINTRKHLYVQRLGKHAARTKIAFMSNLENCIGRNDQDLIEKCIWFEKPFVEVVTALNLACKQKQDSDVKQSILENYFTVMKEKDRTGCYLLKLCKVAIIYNDCRLLGKILKSSVISKKLKKSFELLYFICYVLEFKTCLVTLIQCNVPMSIALTPAQQVDCFVDLLDYGHLRDKAITALKQISNVSDILNSELEFQGSFLHYYIFKLMTKGNYYCSQRSLDTGNSYCQVLKSIVDMDPNSISSMDGHGQTPLMNLLQNQSVNFIPIVRQAAEILIYENPDIRKDTRSILYGIERDLEMKDHGNYIHRATYNRHWQNSFIPDLNEGFLMDGHHHGMFGYDDQDSFPFNFFVPLLIEAGFPLSRADRRALESKCTDLHPSEAAYIVDYLGGIRPLTLCCRDTLRRHFKGRQIHAFVKKLDMPEKIRDFILLKTLLKCTPEDRITRCTNFRTLPTVCF